MQTCVLGNEQISETGWVLRLERRDLSFRAGELISLFGADRLDQRDYTVVSGEDDAELEVLYRLVPHGALTPQLVSWSAGQEIELVGPYGTFVVRDPARPLVFIATGTGIAPARSYRRSHPDLAMTILHGVRIEEDLFYQDEFQAGSDYHACVSSAGRRVTDLVPDLAFPDEADYYLCGANEMIYEVTDQLQARGIAAEHIFTEPYYYRLDT